jgi:site-specific recombinase XerD
MENNLNTKALPASTYEVALYITHLAQSGLKSTTCRTHLSAISFFHKIHSHPDPADSFLIRKLLTSHKKNDDPPAVRKPITAKILTKLIKKIQTSTYTSHSKKLYTSVFTMMYHAALRASETCVTPQSSHTLKAPQLELNKIPTGNTIKIKFTSYKHSQSQPTPLVIYPSDLSTCPIRAYQRYSHSRGRTNGPAFRNRDKTPLTRQQLAKTLHHLLSEINLNPLHFNTHSFRIGRATDMANQGFTYAQIALLGRWKSNAFLKYIKPSAIHANSE